MRTTDPVLDDDELKAMFMACYQELVDTRQALVRIEEQLVRMHKTSKVTNAILSTPDPDREGGGLDEHMEGRFGEPEAYDPTNPYAHIQQQTGYQPNMLDGVELPDLSGWTRPEE